jgi:hypothetical protein
MNKTYWMHGRRSASLFLGLALVGLVACGGGEPAVEEVVEEAPPAAPAMPEATVVDLAEFGTNPGGYEGTPVRLNAVPVTSVLGTNAVWVELPTTPAVTPFLVHTATPPAANTRVDIVGTVTAVTPAAVDEWVNSGVISENDRLVVEFATHYLEAEAIQPSSGM